MPASELILDTREPELESETKLEVAASVNIEDGTGNSSHGDTTVDLTTALAAVCALHVRTYVCRIT